MPSYILRSQDAVSHDGRLFAWRVGIPGRRGTRISVAEAMFPDLDVSVPASPAELVHDGVTYPLPDVAELRDPRHMAAWISDSTPVQCVWNPASKRYHFSGTGTIAPEPVLGVTQALTLPASGQRRPKTGQENDHMLLHCNFMSDAFASTSSGHVRESSVLGIINSTSGHFRNSDMFHTSVLDHELPVIYLWITTVNGQDVQVHSDWTVVISLG